MTYSEEEIQKYLNILHSFNGNYNNRVFYDTIPLKTPEKCLVIIAVILILLKMVVLDAVINVFIQMVALFLMK